MNRLLVWLQFRWWDFQDWLSDWQPCPKEKMGYNCSHRRLSNGRLECGTERNYWGENE